MNVDKYEYYKKGISKNSLPNIGITIGDAAGIGPEIVVKALADGKITKICRPVIVGDISVLKETAHFLGSDIDFVDLEKGVEDPVEPGVLPVIDLANLRGEFPMGEESSIVGRASAEYIEKAVCLWENGKIDAITTAPVNKAALALGGYNFPGHTEFIADLTKTTNFRNEFFCG